MNIIIIGCGSVGRTLAEKLKKAGFDIDDFGDGALLIREVPSLLSATDFGSLLSEIAESLLKTKKLTLKDLSPTYACEKCRDTGYVGTKRCDCFVKENLK